MTPQLLLRISSGLILLHGIGHTFGHSGWKKTSNPVLQDVIKKMTGPKFPNMGVSRSMGEYFDGYGYGISIALFLIAALLWLTAGELSSNTVLAKKIIIAVSAGLLIWGIDEIVCFFPAAAGITLLACAASVYAFFLLP